MRWLASPFFFFFAAAAASSSSSSTTFSSPPELHLPSRSEIFSTLSIHRDLAKFDALNEVLSKIVLKLPDAEVSKSGVNLKFTEIVCSDVNVGDIRLSHSVFSDTTQRIEADVSGVEVSCEFRWEADLGFFGSTGGSGTASSDPSSSVSIDLDFASRDFSNEGPNDASVSSCDANLQISELDVTDDGIGLIGAVIGVLEEVVKNLIEGELNALACDKVNEMADEGEALDDLMGFFSGWTDKYLADEGGVAAGTAADPLSAERNATVPTDEDGNSLWINFIELQENVVELLGVELSELVETVAGASESSSTGEEELGINNFIRENFLNEEGLLVIDPSAVVDGSSAMFELNDMFAMSVQSVSVAGLDSFREMKLFDPIGNYTLQNGLRLEYLTLVLEMEAVVSAPSASESDALVTVTGEEDDGSPVIRESFTVEITMKDVNVDLSLFLGINTRTLGNILLGSILHVAKIPPCFLGAVDESQISSVSVTVADVVPPAVSGFLDEDGGSGSGLDDIITTVIEAFFSMYEGVLMRAMPIFFGTTIRDLVNEYMEDALNNIDACPEPDDTLESLVDYRDLLLPEEQSVELLGRGGSPYGDLFRLLYGYLDEILSNEDALSWLNNFVIELTGIELNEDGDLVHSGMTKRVKVSIGGLNAAIHLGVSDVRVSGLDSLSSLNLLQPVMGESSVLNNTALLGVEPEPLQLSLNLLIKGKGDEVEVHNEVQLSLTLTDAGMLLKLLAQMMEPSFVNFPLDDVFNGHCWMDAMVKPEIDAYGNRVGEPDSGLVLQNLTVSVAEARFDMKCISCSSPMMVDLEEAMRSQEGVEDTTEVTNMILEYGKDLLVGEDVQANIDRALNEAAYHCPHSPAYQQNFPGLEYQELEPVETADDSSFLIAIVVVIAVVAVLAAIIYFVARWATRRRHSRWLETLDRPQKLELARMEQDEKELQKDLNGRMKSLVLSKEIPCLVRLLIPIVILGNIGLFLSGHLSLGGTVSISGSFAGDSFNVDGFFEFSLAKSTIEMWQAGATALAILIVLFSGAWPYTKQLVTLFIWFAPPRWMSQKRRGATLMWLDRLGKWSMVDVFVLLMTLASFRLSIESPDHLGFIPEGLYSIHMMVVPMWGLYANMLAQLLSQVSSHVIIHYHRKTVRAAAISQRTELNLTSSSVGNTPERLRDHSFQLDYEASTKRAVVRKSVNLILFAALLALMTLVICGCSLPSFNIEVLGIVGLVVESGNRFEQAKKYYSVFDLAAMIMDQARYINEASSYVGLGTLASLLVITVFIVPLAQASSLLAQWFAPMTKKQRKRNTVFNEVLSAWQYMEVYVLSIIIAAWQLGGVSEFMINAYCGALDDALASLERLGAIQSEDAQCFRVNAIVEPASWILVASSLLLCILNHFVGTAAVQKAQDDDTPPERRLHTDRWLHNKPALPENVDGDERVETIVDEDEEQHVDSPEDDDGNVTISPIPPRFTDYYHFATTHRNEEQQQEEGVDNEVLETAVAPTVY